MRCKAVFDLFVFTLLLCGAGPAFAETLELNAGQVVSRTAPGQTGISYHVYAPESYDASAAPRPIVIAFSPSGNGSKLLAQLKGGVEQAGWILVTCDHQWRCREGREQVEGH